MAPSQGTGSSPDGSNPPGDRPSPEWYEEQWAVLAEILDVSDPQKVVSRVRTLQETTDAEDEGDTGTAFREMRDQLERLRSQNADLADQPEPDAPQRSETDELHPETEILLDQLDATSLPEAQERVRSLSEQLENLYEEKETLAEAGLMSSQEALGEIDRLQKECDRLRSREEDTTDTASQPPLLESQDEKEELRRLAQDVVEGLDAVAAQVNADSSSPDPSLDDLPGLIRTAHEQVTTLRDTELYDEQSPPPRTEAVDIPDKIENILGVSNAEEARELVSYVFEMNEQLEDLVDEHETLVEHDLDANKAVAMIDSMEDQLVDLYGMAETSQNGGVAQEGSSPPQNGTGEQSIADILGISNPSEARELDRLVRRMSEKLNRLQDKTAKLADSNLTPETALEMIENMEAQLVDLYDEHDTASSVAAQIETLEDVLGIPLPEGEDASSSVTVLAEHIQDLLDEGRSALPDPDDDTTVRSLIHSFRSHLEDLRTERDALADRAERLDAIEDVLGISSLDEARELTALVQNLDSQLQTLYAEREALNEVGLSSVEDAVDMIRSMESQLQELYQEQEALQDLPDRPEQQDTFQQLETLYKEQEKLKRALGVSDADEVIEMVEDLTAQLDETYTDWETDSTEDPAPSAATNEAGDPSNASPPELRMKVNSMRHQLESLYEEKEALLRRGLESAEEATTHIDDLQDELQTVQQKHAKCQERMERLATEFGTTDVSEIISQAGQHRDPFRESGESLPASDVESSQAANDDPFVEAAPSLLPSAPDDLDDMRSSDLDALSVGAIRLDDQGTIQALNEDGQQFPGLRESRSRDRIVGTRLFEEVPSTTNALFLGRFKNGVEQGKMDARFPYTFITPEDQPTMYFIHLYRAGPDAPNWLLFRPALA